MRACMHAYTTHRFKAWSCDEKQGGLHPVRLTCRPTALKGVAEKMFLCSHWHSLRIRFRGPRLFREKKGNALPELS
jgi:hypothetical protein